jgi:hypothetical protein
MKRQPQGEALLAHAARRHEALKAALSLHFLPLPLSSSRRLGRSNAELGKEEFVNPPFLSSDVRNHRLKKGEKPSGITAFVRKAIHENRKGKDVVMVLPLDRWMMRLIEAGARIESLGNLKWKAIEGGESSSGMPVGLFILKRRTCTKG